MNPIPYQVAAALRGPDVDCLSAMTWKTFVVASLRALTATALGVNVNDWAQSAECVEPEVMQDIPRPSSPWRASPSNRLLEDAQEFLTDPVLDSVQGHACIHALAGYKAFILWTRTEMPVLAGRALVHLEWLQAHRLL